MCIYKNILTHQYQNGQVTFSVCSAFFVVVELALHEKDGYEVGNFI